jgi:putative ABC transport system ATP-binding protein
MKIEIENLTKTYNTNDVKVMAVDNVTLSIEEGEFIALVGESGSGKSTLFYLLSGLEKPDTGTVKYDGKDICSLKRDEVTRFRRNEIGLIYQFYNLVPALTVEENIVLPVRLNKKAVDDKKLTALLRILNLAERRNYLPNQLSGGQQQRAAIARALFNSPALILADEPTGNLDNRNSEEIMDYLEKLNVDYNQTIFLITHSEKVAQRAKRIITISDGRITKDDPKK